ncbi:hypothetical protein [Streptomyces sp. ISL-21]|uniref:hypothetical protein n=1 Tax=Streptomyces sp. ISL-21 TaxID=2819179 RepID=UPI001BE751A3|nr:hypothetical protein [Streptomyces sp. ISL-21]MBT2408141.1 hypothetical protein [Streptomyces sp. ISL-21]
MTWPQGAGQPQRRADPTALLGDDDCPGHIGHFRRQDGDAVLHGRVPGRELLRQLGAPTLRQGRAGSVQDADEERVEYAVHGVRTRLGAVLGRGGLANCRRMSGRNR